MFEALHIVDNIQEVVTITCKPVGSLEGVSALKRAVSLNVSNSILCSSSVDLARLQGNFQILRWGCTTVSWGCRHLLQLSLCRKRESPRGNSSVQQVQAFCFHRCLILVFIANSSF